LSPLWRNHTGNQRCQPWQIVRPGSLKELVELVRRAEYERVHVPDRLPRTIRMVGAGHSWSDIALTDGFLLDPRDLDGVSGVEGEPLTEAARERKLVRVLGGTPIHVLNDRLWEMGLGLPNMGGYDAQTIAGVISTSTHGSGLMHGPFPDLVRSLDLVVAGGEVLRLEPADGPTDGSDGDVVAGGGAGEPPIKLRRDDDLFYAAICGLGTLGIVHSAVIEVRERFWLNEVRTLTTWEAVRERLTVECDLGGPDHYELFLNPYAGPGGQHRVLITRRSECEQPPPGTARDKLERHPLTELEASLALTGAVVRFLARNLPHLMTKRFDSVLAGMCDDGYANRSYKVFNIGEANHLPAYSMELGIAVDGKHVEAVDRIIEIAATRSEEGLFHSSPISLRFVGPSRAHASMMHGQPTMMIELIMVTGSRGGYALLEGYESRLAELGARPHWGQYNTLTEERVTGLYPAWHKWLAAEGQLNASGVFDSPFTERVGI
jgi:L-gulono-1,4-lactone dehydrogenase